MDARNTAGGSNSSSSSSTAYFEQQREVLIGDIAQVGNEFSSVEALWSQFENVMAKDEDSSNKAADHQGDETQAEEEETRHE
ncbi:hypothetical protein TASIC1_0003055400 [Trichoderma asperellum]|uniref:DASH complex subunit DAD1 n=1 Tax=Trichoderma asperellum TaxID=101201 RepID=A0A6V8QQT9_TRIAP|nr:hypothetical protein TASIC1_0003055400 [Trichoderma asperellum]